MRKIIVGIMLVLLAWLVFFILDIVIAPVFLGYGKSLFQGEIGNMLFLFGTGIAFVAGLAIG